MNCWHCGTELIWGGDHDLDDILDEEAVVLNDDDLVDYSNNNAIPNL